MLAFDVRVCNYVGCVNYTRLYSILSKVLRVANATTEAAEGGTVQVSSCRRPSEY